MASEKEANRARAQHSDFLRKLGAHSIGVDEGKRVKGFVVIAFFDKTPAHGVPQTLTIKSGKRTIAVPVVVERMKMPSPE